MKESPVSFREAFFVWLWVAANSFGGPAGQIAVMHKKLVEEKRWIGEARFLHALNYCMLLPGPEAQQLATYLGWLLHRTAGGLVAGILFVLPGFVAILCLSLIYVSYRETPLLAAMFFGLKAAVLAVVVEAVIRIGKRALGNWALRAVAAMAFVGIFFLTIPFPVIVIGAGILGWLGHRQRPDLFAAKPHGGGAKTALDALLDEGKLAHVEPSAARTLKVLAIWLPLWLGPVAALVISLGPEHVFAALALFFSKMAVVTFGGAYAVLAYVAQEAVQNYGWLTAGEMLDGLAMAETTPGPLIMVLEFVGFLAAHRAPGSLPPLLAGSLAAILVTWVTFAPCFLWIFLGAPYVERLRANKSLSAALAGITAAVVGVILNLAIWFGLHAIFAKVEPIRIAGIVTLQMPEWASLDGAALALTALSMIAMFRFKLGMLPTLGGAALLGLLWRLGA